MSMNNKTLGLIVTFALVVLMGAIFVGIISDSTLSSSTLTTTTEQVDISPARLTLGGINVSYRFHLKHGCPMATPWRTDLGTECELSNGGVTNASKDVLTDPADYVFVTNGGICTGQSSGDMYFVNSTTMNNSVAFAGGNLTNVTYSYCAEGYVTGWSATVLNLVPGFLVLAILIGAAFLFFYVLKSEGVKVSDM